MTHQGSLHSISYLLFGIEPIQSVQHSRKSWRKSDSPDPVTAQAQISRPSRAIGIVAAWIGVGFSKFSCPNACRVEVLNCIYSVLRWGLPLSRMTKNKGISPVKFLHKFYPS